MGISSIDGRGFVRTIPALIATAAVVVSLAACSTTGNDLASCRPAVATGDQSELVSVSGSGEPSVSFPTPLIAPGIQRTFIEVGEGDLVRSGDYSIVNYSQFNGADEELIGSTWTEGEPAVVPAGEAGGVLGETIACTPVGSVVSATIPVRLFNQEADPEATLVVVVEVLERFMGKANGVDQLAQAGFPAVVTAPNGQPGISIPARTDPPTELGIAVLKRGDGPVVAEGDSVYTHYTGMLWSGSSIFDSSWDRGVPTALVAQEGTAGQDGLIPGFAEALVGQTVGSQVIVVIPPELGYGEAGTEGVPGGSTLVFVFDVLGIQS